MAKVKHRELREYLKSLQSIEKYNVMIEPARIDLKVKAKDLGIEKDNVFNVPEDTTFRFYSHKESSLAVTVEILSDFILKTYSIYNEQESNLTFIENEVAKAIQEAKQITSIIPEQDMPKVKWNKLGYCDNAIVIVDYDKHRGNNSDYFYISHRGSSDEYMIKRTNKHNTISLFKYNEEDKRYDLLGSYMSICGFEKDSVSFGNHSDRLIIKNTIDRDFKSEQEIPRKEDIDNLLDFEPEKW